MVVYGRLAYKTIKNVPKDWALNRYGLFFEQIHSLETQCEMHIIGGDFDRLLAWKNWNSTSRLFEK